MAPRRPLLYADQVPLAIITGVVLMASIGLVVWVVFSG